MIWYDMIYLYDMCSFIFGDMGGRFDMINVGWFDWCVDLFWFGFVLLCAENMKGSQEWCHICEFWGWLVSIIGGWPVGYPEVLDLQPFASSIHLASSPRMQANRSILVLIHSERVWECNTHQDSIRPTRIPNWTFMLQDYILKISKNSIDESFMHIQ